MIASSQPARLSLQVQRVVEEAHDVLSLFLSTPGRQQLPAWTPGAHIDLVLPSGLVRQYSLCGSPSDRTYYKIAVLRNENSRGGSKEIHQLQLPGSTFEVSHPRNHFRLTAQHAYKFIAGGIGITPILPMIAEVEARGAPWSLLYGGRRRESMAFCGELGCYNPASVQLVPEDEYGLPDIAGFLGQNPQSAGIFCCGPSGLIHAAQKHCKENGFSGALHVERFDPDTASPASGTKADSPFELELHRSGRILTVPPDRSILDVVRDVVPGVPYSCERGVCGACEVAVLDGRPDHRDAILADEERAEGKTMMMCVSRSLSPRLVLDI